MRGFWGDEKTPIIPWPEPQPGDELFRVRATDVQNPSLYVEVTSHVDLSTALETLRMALRVLGCYIRGPHGWRTYNGGAFVPAWSPEED